MTKRSFEIDDTLQECVDGAIDGVKEALIEYLKENPDADETPEIVNDLDYSGTIHEIVDGAVPIYTQEITDIFYLHGDEVEQAFDDAGIGTKGDKGWPMGWKAAAIYCYIDQQVHEWYSANAEDIFEEWKEKRDAEGLPAGGRNRPNLCIRDGSQAPRGAGTIRQGASAPEREVMTTKPSKLIWKRLNALSHRFGYDSAEARLLTLAAQRDQKLVAALRELTLLCDNVPIFQLDDGKASVKAVRLAGKFTAAHTKAHELLREIEAAE